MSSAWREVKVLLLFADQISLALALEDFIPVLLFAVGLFIIARLISATNTASGKLAIVGGAFVTFGGLSKATWKLIQAIGGDDISLLNNALFVLMSAGFICLAWAFWNRGEPVKSAMWIWLPPVVAVALAWSLAAVLAFSRENRAWFFVLLGATTLANLAFLSQLILASVKRRLWFVVAFLCVNLVVIFLQTRTGDQTMTLQWIKQFANTISQFCFLAAAYLLLRNSYSTSVQK